MRAHSFVNLFPGLGLSGDPTISIIKSPQCVLEQQNFAVDWKNNDDVVTCPVQTMPKVKRVKKVAAIDHETLGTQHGSAEASSLALAKEHAPKVKQLIDDFRQVCVSAVPVGGGDAQGMEAYMRNQFKFFGLKAPLRKQLQLLFVRKHTDELQDHALLLALCTALWNESKREFQYFSVDLLRRYRQELLGGGTSTEFWAVMGCVERLICTKSWWDTVDGLAYPGTPPSTYRISRATPHPQWQAIWWSIAPPSASL